MQVGEALNSSSSLDRKAEHRPLAGSFRELSIEQRIPSGCWVGEDGGATGCFKEHRNRPTRREGLAGADPKLNRHAIVCGVFCLSNE